MVLQLVPFIPFLNFFVEIVVPLRRTIPLLIQFDSSYKETDSTEIRINEIQWTMYWIVFTIYRWLLNKDYVSNILEKLPFHRELKFAFIFWLVSQEFQGAAWIWFNIVEIRFEKLYHLLTYHFPLNKQLVNYFINMTNAERSNKKVTLSRQEKYTKATTILNSLTEATKIF
ncbi:uncharacterized protein LOC128883339 [Hylaeus volcanicus]|uniref:uncharacterized protein LOC128883339 n=1 Tax=Hylaeus volcanicus TaxID=313075 RepID=UPI0023B84741|nr:uncharacterized protein LOC128883339 [Hylaeus volcanicus]XP_053991552.1 uncharacterized protein LOC128883339 [Hylaeus volcanicus]